MFGEFRRLRKTNILKTIAFFLSNQFTFENVTFLHFILKMYHQVSALEIQFFAVVGSIYR